MASPILDRVRKYLFAHRREIPAICKTTGLKESWMKKVAFGHIPNPGIVGIEKVANYIREKRRNKSNGHADASQPPQPTSHH